MMKKWERSMEKERYKNDHKIPSFSSTLLDEIYRSIDDGEKKAAGDTKFYRETAPAKKNINNRAFEDDEMENLRRACLNKWVEKKVDIYRRQELYRKSQLDSDHDRDVLFFSSTSISSDSSSGGLSCSDTESMFSTRSCFAPRPIRTIGSIRSEKPGRKKSAVQVFDDYPYGSEYKSGGLKKMKQPISPGARLAGFLNSIFTGNSKKKTKNTPATEKKPTASEELTTCSASSFARSCLSKHSASKTENGVKRTVRFCPESIIYSEDFRPRSHRCLYEENGSGLMAVSIPTAWKIGRLPATKAEEKAAKPPLAERGRKVEDVAREFLKIKKNLSSREFTKSYRDFVEDDEDDDDVSSCSSSDLFELDDLEMIGRRRYGQELPVYETTHAEKNRAIAKSLLLQS